MKKNALSLSIAGVLAGFAGGVLADVISQPFVAAAPGPNPSNGNPVNGLFRQTNATVLAVNPGGVGHHLIVPYFTVQDNQSTAFHITNTDPVNGKAVKVRFRGAGNSDDILDFQVFLSPGDVFGAGLRQGPNDELEIFTTDNSCTIPRFDAVTQGDAAKAPNNEGFLRGSNARMGDVLGLMPRIVGMEGTREGYIEIFNMADLVPPGLGGRPVAGADSARVYTASKHLNGVPPCNANVFGYNGDTGAILLNNQNMTAANVANLANVFGFDTPTTGLASDWYIINGVQNTAFSGEAIALEARVGVAGPAARGNFVYFPQTITGYVADGNTQIALNHITADPLFRASAGGDRIVAGIDKQIVNGVIPLGSRVTAPRVPALMMDLPDMSTPYLAGFTAATGITTGIPAETQIQSVSQALAASRVMNHFVTNGNFETDWVFSMPTRRYSVALDYAITAGNMNTNGARVFSPSIVGLAGNVSFFNASNTQALTAAQLGGTVAGPRICVATNGRTATGREEQQLTTSVSPVLTNAITFCGETTVLTFNGSSVLDSELSTQNISILPASLQDGWLNVNTSNTNGIATAQVGLPVVGYAAIKAVNDGFAPSRNFGYTWPHKTVAP